MDIPSLEFLVESGFQEVEYPDGIFWLKWVSNDLTYWYDPVNEVITEHEKCWIRPLTYPELIATIAQHNAVIIQ